MQPSHGRWHGRAKYFGLHYDLHARVDDTELGLHCAPEELVPLLELAGPDFLQTDCKGHPGYASWESRTPEASVPPGLRADALKGWREAARRMGIPLHCHYSGLWDAAAGAKHPEWQRLDAEGKPVAGRMCTRRGYVEGLMIPQLLELVDGYEVDGFWIDGDLWATEPCWCGLCREEFSRRTGIAEIPKKPQDPDWAAWISFQLESFNEYVTRYCEAVHARREGILVCSNWLQTFRNPGPPAAPTDWISGDNAWMWGMDASRCEARFLSTRGKHWDIMLWSFCKPHAMEDPESPWVFKPLAMLQQEAAVILALGGGLQVYETVPGIRDGRLVPWRMKELGELGRFAKARRSLCQDSETIGQIAVLHSESHAAAHRGANLMWGVDTAPARGAVCSLLENHYNVDLMDEWALRDRLSGFPCVVVPEQAEMSERMVGALKDWVLAGGKLLLTGAGVPERFGEEFLGVKAGPVLGAATWHLPVGERTVPAYSASWRFLEPLEAKPMAHLGRSGFPGDLVPDAPAWTLRKAGDGAVAYVPFDLFRFFDRERPVELRRFIGTVAARLAGRLPIRVAAPSCVDVVLRKHGARTLVHLINRASGIPATAESGIIDEIPVVGPVIVEMDVPFRPRSVTLAFEKEPVQSKFEQAGAGGTLFAAIARLRIHAALVVEVKPEA